MKILSIKMSIADVKRAMYYKDAGFFKEALLSRLEAAATQTDHFGWRCVGEYKDDAEDTVMLVFEEVPESHGETLLTLTHKINRLLEETASGEEE